MIYTVYIPKQLTEQIKFDYEDAEVQTGSFGLDLYVTKTYLFTSALTSTNRFYENELDRDYKLKYGVAYYTSEKGKALKRYATEVERRLKKLKSHITEYLNALKKMTPESCFKCSMRVKSSPEEIMCIMTGDVFDEEFSKTIESRNHNCPFDIKTEAHGRLIDADKLLTEICEEYNKSVMKAIVSSNDNTLGAIILQKIKKYIEEAETVVEGVE